MKIKQHLLRKIANEWEIAALVLVVAILALLLLMVATAGGGLKTTGAGGRQLPIKPARINSETAYALLNDANVQELPEEHAFKSGLKAYEPREPPKKKKHTPRETPKQEEPPKQEPEEENEEEEPQKQAPPEEQPEPQPEWHVYVYEGYTRSNTGRKVGIMHNVTTGQKMPLQVGHKWRGMMVSELSATEVTFLTPAGRDRSLPANREFKVRGR